MQAEEAPLVEASWESILNVARQPPRNKFALYLIKLIMVWYGDDDHCSGVTSAIGDQDLKIRDTILFIP